MACTPNVRSEVNRRPACLSPQKDAGAAYCLSDDQGSDMSVVPVQEATPEALALAARFACIVDTMRPDAQFALELFLQTCERGMAGQVVLTVDGKRRASNPEVQFTSGTTPLKAIG